MPEYRVLRGTHRREDGTLAEPGDTVTFADDDERAQFSAEKFEPVEQDDEPSGTDVAPTPAEAAGDDTADADADSADAEVESEPETDATVEQDIAPSPEDADDIDSAGDLPDDWEMLQAMAVVYDGDEVKGNSSQTAIEEHFGEFSDTEIAILKDKAESHLYADPDDAETDTDTA